MFLKGPQRSEHIAYVLHRVEERIARVLAILPKRHGKTLVTFLTREETDALINAVAVSTWTGRRERAMLMLAAQTGLRASELVGLAIADVHLGTGGARQLHREGPHAEDHSADHHDDQDAPRLAFRARRSVR